MIKIQDAERKFQRCNSCYNSPVKAVKIRHIECRHTQVVHLCDDCLKALGKLTEIVNSGVKGGTRTVTYTPKKYHNPF